MANKDTMQRREVEERLGEEEREAAAALACDVNILRLGWGFSERLHETPKKMPHHNDRRHLLAGNFPCSNFTFPPSSNPPQHTTMESLSDTKWDAVISGTGLQQSLLAL